MTTSHTAIQRSRTSLYLSPRPSACPRARQWAAAALTHWEATGEETGDVLLVMSELVTNAIVHATGPIRAHLARDTAGHIHVVVDDGGPARYADRDHDDDQADEHGRGLGIVDHLAARHGQGRAPAPYRSRVWAVLAPATRTAGPCAVIPAARTLEPTS